MLNSLILCALLTHAPTPVSSQDSLIAFSLAQVDMPMVTEVAKPRHVRLGIYFAPPFPDSVEALKLIPPGLPALRIRQLVRGMSADASGIQLGDIIFGIDDKPIGDTTGKIPDYLGGILDAKKEGDIIRLKLVRGRKIKTVKVRLKVSSSTEMSYSKPPELGDVRPSSWLSQAVERHNLQEPLDETLRQIAACADMEAGDIRFTERPSPWRLNAMTYLAHYPFRTGAYSRLIVKDLWAGLPYENSLADTTGWFNRYHSPREITEEKAVIRLDNFVGSTDRRGLSGVVAAAGKHLDIKIEPIILPELPQTRGGIESYLGIVQSTLDEAYAPVKDDLPRLKTELLRVLDGEDNWEGGIDTINDENVRNAKRLEVESWFIDIFDKSDRIQREELLKAGQILAGLADTNWVQGFLADLPTSQSTSNRLAIEAGTVDGDVLALWDTENGRFVVGGYGSNRYSGEFLFILDPGGDDSYNLPAATCGSCRFVMDLAGDDQYSGNDFGPGSGVGSLDLVCDVAGDDVYRGVKFAQGSGLLGIGILADWSGDDYYFSRWCSQAAGFLGIGILYDGSGEDSYTADAFSQGFAYLRGFGAMMECDGDDNYKAGWEFPDYRNPKRAHMAMSQGYGYGMRPWSTGIGSDGGIGVLTDLRGSDLYNSDFFCQGASYWYALGILHDGQGCDRYTAGQYSQGSGIHLSFGALLDDEGDDLYDAYAGLEQGNAHDWSAGCLEDHNGNDTYIAPGNATSNSQGCGLTVSVAWLLDNIGNDKYIVQQGDTTSAQGGGNYNEERKSGGLGLLIDLGKGKDIISDPRVVPGGELVKGRYGILFDDGE